MIITQDTTSVDYMSKAPHAEAMPNNEALAVTLPLPESLKRNADLTGTNEQSIRDERNQFVKTIRKHISCGRAVKITGWRPELRIDFNKDDIALICPSMDQVVQYQGEYLRFVFNPLYTNDQMQF